MAYGIHIDLNAGNDGRGVMLYTLAHELTHHIRKNSPEKFKAFADVVMKGYGDRGISAENLIQEQIAKAKRNGRDISYDEAYEEMIADSMEGILADGKVLEKLKGLQESDPSLWETVKQWAKDIAEKIRAIVDAYKGERMDSTEGRIVANMKEILPQQEELYAEGLPDTRENYQGDNTTGEKSSSTNTDGKKFSIRKDVVDVNGKHYDDVVELEYGVFNKIKRHTKAWLNFIRNNLIKQKITVYNSNGDAETIEFAKENERVQKDCSNSSRRVLGELERIVGDTRKLVVANAVEVAEISQLKNHSSINNHQWLDSNGWDERWSYVMTEDGTIYKAILQIAKSRDGRSILYGVNVDITKGVSIDKSATSVRANEHAQPAVKVPTPFEHMLTQTEKTVKRELSDRDSSGIQLSKEQADYFRNSKVRDEKGNLLVMYHGTPNGGFTKFRSGSYFTQNPDYAALYQNPGASMLGYKKGADNPQNYQVYLNIEKPFDTRNPKERRIFVQEYYRKYGTGAPLSDSGLPDWTDGMDLQEFGI